MKTLSWLEQIVPPGEHIVAPDDAYVICFLLGTPFRLEQVREGKTRYEFAARGMMQVISFEENRIFRHRDAAQNMHVFLPSPLVQQIGEEGIDIIPRASFRDERIAHLIFALKSAGNAPPESGANTLFRDSMGLALIAALQEVPAEEARSEAMTPLRSKRIIELMHDRLQENLSLEELAAATGLRPSHFTAQFRATFGVSPHRYLLEQRVHRAMEMLQKGDQSPAEVAIAVGFYDQSHLTRHMRRLVGITPAQIKHASKQNSP